MSNQTVGAVYSQIITDVIDSSRVDFEEMGVEESVLEDLKKVSTLSGDSKSNSTLVAGRTHFIISVVLPHWCPFLLDRLSISAIFSVNMSCICRWSHGFVAVIPVVRCLAVLPAWPFARGVESSGLSGGGRPLLYGSFKPSPHQLSLVQLHRYPALSLAALPSISSTLLPPYVSARLQRTEAKGCTESQGVILTM